MTFIQGERREEAFEEQEERRALSIHDKRDAAAALDALLGVVKEAAALAVEAADAGGAAAEAGDLSAAGAKAEEAERQPGAAFSAFLIASDTRSTLSAFGGSLPPKSQCQRHQIIWTLEAL